jgi:lysophospholipase L1-like esterase
LPETKIANRGIGGDVTRGILFRFKEDVLDLNPAAIVICAGTNDLSAHANPDAVAGNLSKILDQIAEKNSSLPVVLCTIPPRDNPKAPLKSPDAVNQLNEEIKLLAAARDNVELLDVFAALSTSEGKPNPDYFGQDLLHLSPEGYKKWAEVLAPAIAKAVNK